MNNWSFGTRIICAKGADASPHTSYLFEFLKNIPGRQRSRANFQV
jgi:hypothetical protein